jgi:hypothetical protein
MRLNSQAPRLYLALLAGLIVAVALSSRWGEAKPATGLSERDAILAEIKALGGSYELQRKPKGEPQKIVEVVRVTVHGPKVDDAFLDRLKYLENIEALFLWGIAATDQGMKHIGEMKGLTNLQIRSDHVTDAGMRPIEGLRDLEYLYFHFPKITDTGLKPIGELPRVAYLNIWSEKVTDEGLRYLLTIESVQDIGIYGQSITNACLRYLEGNTTLNSLDLSSAQITDEGLRHLLEAKALTGITLRSPKISDQGLATIGKMNQLQRLHLHNVPLTDVGLEHLKNLTEMQGLYLTNTAATGDGLKHLDGMQDLAQLSLTGTQVSDAAFGHLHLFPKLTHLSMGAGFNNKHESHITDKALKAMLSATSVRYLTFDTTRVTDVGLMSLAELPDLENVLFLRTPGLTKAGVEQFKQARPKVRFNAGDPDLRADEGE